LLNARRILTFVATASKTARPVARRRPEFANIILPRARDGPDTCFDPSPFCEVLLIDSHSSGDDGREHAAIIVEPVGARYAGARGHGAARPPVRPAAGNRSTTAGRASLASSSAFVQTADGHFLPSDISPYTVWTFTTQAASLVPTAQDLLVDHVSAGMLDGQYPRGCAE